MSFRGELSFILMINCCITSLRDKKKNNKKVIDSFNVMSYLSSFNKSSVLCYLSVTCENQFLDKPPFYFPVFLS